MKDGRWRSATRHEELAWLGLRGSPLRLQGLVSVTAPELSAGLFSTYWKTNRAAARSIRVAITYTGRHASPTAGRSVEDSFDVCNGLFHGSCQCTLGTLSHGAWEVVINHSARLWDDSAYWRHASCTAVDLCSTSSRNGDCWYIP